MIVTGLIQDASHERTCLQLKPDVVWTGFEYSQPILYHHGALGFPETDPASQGTAHNFDLFLAGGKPIGYKRCGPDPRPIPSTVMETGMLSADSRFNSVGRGLAAIIAVLLVGTLWFTFVDGYSVVDALYMTVITISTVGFGEVKKLDSSDRLFVIFLIISGIMVMTYTLGALGRDIIEGSIQRFVGRQRMLREIEKLKDHYIICGHGRMGAILCGELQSEGVPFVVVDGDPETAEQLIDMGYRVVEGDATQDQVLERAGVGRARALVAVVSRDVDNLYITMSAREMAETSNPELFILSRATDEAASRKIRRAGADRVISPYHIGGMRIVQALLRPTVYDFVDIATQNKGLDLMFEELKIGADSRLDGLPLKDSGIRAGFDVMVIGIKKPDGRMVFNPGPDTVLQVGDVLIMLGDKEQLVRLAATGV